MSKIDDSYREFKRIRKIGDHTVTLPEPPPIEEIDNYDKPISQQKFTPTKIPFDFVDWSEIDKEKFIDQEYKKSEEGYWFFNKGKLEYITGHNYFYITWWKIKVSKQGQPKQLGLPNFLDSDRDFYYLWDFVENNPKVGGLVYVTNRREGKSYKGGEILYKRAISYRNSHSGIQSKTEDDAKSVLGKLIQGWAELPYFFRPANDGQLNPTKSLRFFPPSKKDTKTKIKDQKKAEDYLYSSIDFRSTVETAYDGEDLLTYMLDESGKTLASNVYQTLLVVLRTMVDGTYITGKCFVTSTVEEMEKKGGKHLMEIWKESDVKDKTDLGMTKTTLIRYLKPAYLGFRGEDEDGNPFIDEYGYTDWKRAKTYLEKRRRGLSGEALLSEKRQYPFNDDDAFQLVTNDTVFDGEKIKANLKYNQVHVNSDNLLIGNLKWTSSIDVPEVYFEPNPDGNFYIKWMPNPEDRNKYAFKHTPDGNQRYPTVNSCAGGCDPFDNKTTTDNRRSDGGIHLYRKYNPMYPDDSDCFVLEYIHRPKAPEHFWEDALKACIFYSCELLCENNKIGLINYARMNGYYGYIMERPESTHTAYSKKRTVEKGISMSGEKPREYLINKVTSYVHNHLGYDEEGNIKNFMPFDRTLKDYAKFQPKNWTDYDATVSSGLALIGAEERRVQSTLKSKEMIIPRFNNNGLVSNIR